jgi:Xaa-Pro dipeptidase
LLANRKNFLSNLSNKLENFEKNSILVILGGQDIPRFDTDVVNYHFVQDPNFYYLTGVRDTEFYGILDFNDSSITLFWKVPDESKKIWSYVPSLEELTKLYGIPVKSQVDFYDFIAKRDPKVINSLYGTNSDSNLKVRPFDFKFPTKYEYFNDRLDKTELIYEMLADARTRKTKEEIEFIKFLNDITAEAHINVIKSMKNFQNERDFETSFFEYISVNYFTRFTGYQLVSANGRSSATIDYNSNNKDVNTSQINLFDMGVKIAGYITKLSTCIPAIGKFDYIQKEFYNLVLKASKKIQSEIKPGVYFTDIHLLGEAVILEGLQQLGFLNEGFSINDMLRDRIAYFVFPHGMAHYIGLHLHDIGGYLSFTPKRSNKLGLNKLRSARKLEENNVLIIEPGIYFIERLLGIAFRDPKIEMYFNKELCRSFYNFGGMRIEDSVWVSKDRAVILSGMMPRDISVLEELAK